MVCAVHAGQHREALRLEEGFGAGRDLAGDPAAEGSCLGRDARSRLHISLALVKGRHHLSTRVTSRGIRDGNIGIAPRGEGAPPVFSR